MKILLIDPAIYRNSGEKSPNIGDQIISRATQREIKSIFGEYVDIARVPSHDYPEKKTIDLLNQSDYVFVGGANLLTFKFWRPTPWKIGIRGYLNYKNLILFGTGWGAYWSRPNAYGKHLCQKILSRNYVHSVRDRYTMDIMINNQGIKNVTNTHCPTMWCLTDSLIDSIHVGKGNSCVFSLTDYDRNFKRDSFLINKLHKYYGNNLILWPQGPNDEKYAVQLGYRGKVIKRDLDHLIQHIRNDAQIDYVGTRLHAGILCLEHKVRALIVCIDNRAREIAKDTGLSTIEDRDLEKIDLWITSGKVCRLKISYENINDWRSQFDHGLDCSRHFVG